MRPPATASVATRSQARSHWIPDPSPLRVRGRKGGGGAVTLQTGDRRKAHTRRWVCVFSPAYSNWSVSGGGAATGAASGGGGSIAYDSPRGFSWLMSRLRVLFAYAPPPGADGVAPLCPSHSFPTYCVDGSGKAPPCALHRVLAGDVCLSEARACASHPLLSPPLSRAVSCEGTIFMAWMP